MSTLVLIYTITVIFNGICLYFFVQKHRSGKCDMMWTVMMITMIGFLPIGSVAVSVILILVGFMFFVSYLVEKMLGIKFEY